MPLTGDPPNPINPPSGCRFRTRCAFAEAICAERVPPLAAPLDGDGRRRPHLVACHLPAAQPAWRARMPDIMPPEPPVLRVEDLTVRFRRRGIDVAAVNGVSFALARGEMLTILGESGSGKSVSLKALMGLLPDYAQHRRQGLAGRPGRSSTLPPAELAKLRGGAISMIFQEPMTALDPVYTIGEQIAETIVPARRRRPARRDEARAGTAGAW